jgi:RNA polymerase sigma-70 factor (ECF subfamily)
VADDTDHALVRRSLKGDNMAFAALVDRYQNPLFNTALRMTGDREDARDLTQSALVKAYDKLPSFNFRYKFFSWVYRILVNEAIDWKSSRKRLTRADVDCFESEDNPELAFERYRQSKAIEAALTKLNFDQRLVVVLFYFNDMAYREISEIVGIAEGKVKSRLHSARQRLAELLIAEGVRSHA